MHGPKVNTGVRQTRTFTVTAFTLLMGLNQLSPGAEPAPAATPKSTAWHPDGKGRQADRQIKRRRPRRTVGQATDQERRGFRNFSRKRPETTNLNHQ